MRRTARRAGNRLALVAFAPVLLIGGCGYTTRPGLSTHLKTVYVKPFANRIDLSGSISNVNRLAIYRPAMEVDITNAVLDRYQFTGLLRPAGPAQADARLEGELIDYRRDALRYNASQQVEEWRLSVVVALKFYDQTTNTLEWEEPQFIGDATYFAIGAKAESEEAALDRAITDLARRVVERSVENW